MSNSLPIFVHAPNFTTYLLILFFEYMANWMKEILHILASSEDDYFFLKVEELCSTQKAYGSSRI